MPSPPYPLPSTAGPGSNTCILQKLQRIQTRINRKKFEVTCHPSLGHPLSIATAGWGSGHRPLSGPRAPRSLSLDPVGQNQKRGLILFVVTDKGPTDWHEAAPLSMPLCSLFRVPSCPLRGDTHFSRSGAVTWVQLCISCVSHFVILMLYQTRFAFRLPAFFSSIPALGFFKVAIKF